MLEQIGNLNTNSALALPILKHGGSDIKARTRDDRSPNASPDRMNSISPREMVNGTGLALNVRLDSGMGINGNKHKRNMSHGIRLDAKREANELSKSVQVAREYKVSVRDMVNSSKKCMDEYGIPGWENPHVRFNPFTKRSLNYSVSKDTMPRDYIS